MPAIASCRLRRLRDPSTAASRDQVCSPMFWYRSMPIMLASQLCDVQSREVRKQGPFLEWIVT